MQTMILDESLTRKFAAHAPPLLEMFRAHTRYRRLEAGEYLFRQGDPASHLYGVVAGRLLITVGVPDTPKEAIVAMLVSGQICGELSIIDGGVRSANVRAETPALIGAISREDFIRELTTHPEVTWRLLTMLSRRLRGATSHTESLALWDIPARLAKVLLELSDQDGKPSVIGRTLNSPISQRTLAAMIGSTREWVNAILHDWQRDGKIGYDGRRLVIYNPVALQALVEAVEMEV
ncbi:MAG: Crp/Fnr family transcriptional regulator [Aggregatilineales bacterium]